MQITKNTSLIVIDFETLGTDTDKCPILSLGVVIGGIDGNITAKKEYIFPLIEQLNRVWSHIEVDTIDFWQKPENVETFNYYIAACMANRTNLCDVLCNVKHYLSHKVVFNESLLIGNSPDFDNAILKRLFSEVDISFPWKYNQEFDFRSVRNLFKLANADDTYTIPSSNNKHNAVADAVWEYKQLCAYIKAINDKV